MRVNYYFTDKIDTYKIEAEVGKRVQIIAIEDSYGSDVDFDDFSDDEKRAIYAKAYAARDALEASEEPDYDDDSDEGEAAYE
jgi:hypothetical protein